MVTVATGEKDMCERQINRESTKRTGKERKRVIKGELRTVTVTKTMDFRVIIYLRGG